MNRMPENAWTAFMRLFRHEAFRPLEYSYDDDSAAAGLMIVARQRDLLQRVGALADSVHAGASRWHAAVADLLAGAPAAGYFVKADGDPATIRRLTVYARYAAPLADDEVRGLLSGMLPAWSVRLPAARIALDCAGPYGVGVRLDDDGSCAYAVYYLVEQTADAFVRDDLVALVDWLAWPQEQVQRIAAVVRALHQPGQLGPVGFGFTDAGEPRALKLDAPGIPLQRALAFARRLGATERRIGELKNIARALQLDQFNYVGVTLAPPQPVRWKFYMPVRPQAVWSAGLHL